MRPSFMMLAVIGMMPSCKDPATWDRPAPAPAAVADPIVRVDGGHLSIDGRPFRFVGVNVYSLLGAPPDACGFACGRRRTDEELERMFWDLKNMGTTVIRIHAFQSFIENGHGRLDLVIAKANRHGIRLILTLENQWADCSQGGYKHADWYRDGYRRPYGDYRRSYRDHVAALAERYRGEPAILMWQLMNEAESKTREGRPDPDALQLFATDIGAVIKIRDPDHLVSLGTIGAGRPGLEDASYAAIASSPWIDVVVAHDYGAENDALPPATAACIRAARAAGKPCVIGEIGVSARQRVGRSLRADRIMRKIDAALLAGANGALIWSYGAGDGVHMDIERGDPLIERLRTYVLP